MENRLEKLEDKIDKLTNICIDNRSHLKNINGTILTHQTSIECHRKKINNINEFKNRVVGGLMVIVFIVSVTGIKVFLI